MTNWTTRSALLSSAVLALGLATAASPASAQSLGNGYPPANSAGNNPGPAGTNTYGNPNYGAPNSGPYYSSGYGNGYNGYYGNGHPFFGWGPAAAPQQYGSGYGNLNNYPAPNSAGNNPGPAGSNTSNPFYGNPNNGNINSTPDNYYPRTQAHMGAGHMRHVQSSTRYRRTHGNVASHYPAANTSSYNSAPSNVRNSNLSYSANSLNDWPRPNAPPAATAVSAPPAPAPNPGPGPYAGGPAGPNTVY